MTRVSFFFHAKCCGINHKIYNSFKESDINTWHCKSYTPLSAPVISKRKSDYACGECDKTIPIRNRIIKCDLYIIFFHVKCCGINYKTFRSIKESNNDTWHCKSCVAVDSFIINEIHLNIVPMQTKTKKKSKCGKCLKSMHSHLEVINCDTCQKYFHLKCSGITKNIFLELKLKNEKWICFKCVSNLLPFSHLDNNELFLEMENKANLLNSTPCFTIHFLLDEMPGQNFETNDFMGENISSKYFTPAEFLECKFPPNKLSMLHINISSLSKHVDGLRNLLFVLSLPFDIIGITENTLHETDPLSNIDISGYVSRHTPATTQCGGVGIYIKTCYNFDVKEDLSKSISNVSESIFIELKRNGKKNLLVGCIYRHHTPISTFVNEYFEKALNIVSKQNNKICALMGDFNVDLIKYTSEAKTGDFYDLLCSHSFRPLILQPTRVTSRTSTLIDNIFINDVSCYSSGGNLTSSISDHFLQFAQTDIFETCSFKKKIKFARDFRFFNKREFAEELTNIDWSNKINEQVGTEISYQNFYSEIE